LKGSFGKGLKAPGRLLCVNICAINFISHGVRAGNLASGYVQVDPFKGTNEMISLNLSFYSIKNKLGEYNGRIKEKRR